MFLEGTLVKEFEAESTCKMLRVKFLAHCRDTFPHYWFLATCTECSSCSMVVNLTVWFPFMVKIVATGKWHIANLDGEDEIVILTSQNQVSYLASKAVWMPLCIKCRDKAFHYSFFTAFAARSKLLIIAFTAKGLPIFLMEPFSSKMFTAKGTKEVLRVPCSVQCTHHFLNNTKDASQKYFKIFTVKY